MQIPCHGRSYAFLIEYADRRDISSSWILTRVRHEDKDERLEICREFPG